MSDESNQKSGDALQPPAEPPPPSHVDLSEGVRKGLVVMPVNSGQGIGIDVVDQVGGLPPADTAPSASPAPAEPAPADAPPPPPPESGE